MLNSDEAINEFLVESHENLDQLDRDFVALEAEPTATARLAGIFRTVHTIKGTSGFLGYSKLEALTHAGEHLLSKLRDGAMLLTPERTSALLEMVDRVRAILRSIEATGAEGELDCSGSAERLRALSAPDAVSPAPSQAALGSPPAAAPAAPQAAAPEATAPQATAPQASAPQASAPQASAPQASAPQASAPQASAPQASAPQASAPQASASNGASLNLSEPQASAPSVSAPEVSAPQPSALTPEGPGVSDGNVRVDVALLDRLMNLVGELVLARNQVLQFGAKAEDAAFTSTAQRLNLITTELQAGVMKTRMQPIGNVWNKLPRVARDLSIQCGKQVRIEMIGKETELDRTIIEAIKDPLTHIVRNAIDHGLETPEVRAAAGKPRTGTLRLRAFHEGGQVNIEISDDGAGVRSEAVRAKAVQNGTVTAERAARMSERELCQLVFLPGFSTAAKVTNVSGRGVGMDVVKTNIEKIGGTVDLQSTPGRGTTLRIKIPLTLAIVPALIVTSRGHRFAVPQVSLHELVRLEGARVRTGIERIHGAPVYRLRGNLLPLVDLGQTLGLRDRRPPAAATGKPPEDEVLNIVVVQADGRQFGLVVDEVKDTEEIVVKPLGKELKSVTVFAGATVMGDGRVALILDVLGLAVRAGANSSARDRAQLEAAIASSAAATAAKVEEKQALLLFRVGAEGCMAMPLALVSRLEEFRGEQFERAGQRGVVQYRGEILPLLELGPLLGTGARADASLPVPVVVYSQNGRSIGLVVDRILDIVEDSLAVGHRISADCVQGAAVIQGRVTELLDVPAFIRKHEPGFFEARSA